MFTITCSAPKRSWRVVDRGLHAVRVGHVGVHERGGLAELAHQPDASLRVEVGDDDPSALLHEHLGDRPADPVRAAGDDRDLALELVAHGMLTGSTGTARIMGRMHMASSGRGPQSRRDPQACFPASRATPSIDIFVRKSQHHRVPAPRRTRSSRPPRRRKPFADSPVIGPRGLRTHQRVLDAALEAFAESGYDRTTLDRIAELAGCSRVTIYQYASGKDELFRRLATQAAAQMWAAFEALEDVTPDASGHASLLACISRLADIEARYEPIIRAFEAAAETDRLPGGRSGLHHPTSRRRLRSPARRRPTFPRGCSTRPSSSSTPA